MKNRLIKAIGSSLSALALTGCVSFQPCPEHITKKYEHGNKALIDTQYWIDRGYNIEPISNIMIGRNVYPEKIKPNTVYVWEDGTPAAIPSNRSKSN